MTGLMVDELASLNDQIKSLQADIAAKRSRLGELEERARSIRAKMLVASLGVRRADIAMSDVPDKWFGHVAKFGLWLSKTNCTKPFAEWNGMVYRTLDVMRGELPHDWPLTIDDVPE